MIDRIKAEALAILVKIIVLVLIFWVLLFGAFGVYRIDDYAMSPSCKDGDIIFFDWENDGSADHVGIVEKVAKEHSVPVTLL